MPTYTVLLAPYDHSYDLTNSVHRYGYMTDRVRLGVYSDDGVVHVAGECMALHPVCNFYCTFPGRHLRRCHGALL